MNSLREYLGLAAIGLAGSYTVSLNNLIGNKLFFIWIGVHCSYHQEKTLPILQVFLYKFIKQYSIRYCKVSIVKVYSMYRLPSSTKVHLIHDELECLLKVGDLYSALKNVVSFTKWFFQN